MFERALREAEISSKKEFDDTKRKVVETEIASLSKVAYY